MAPEDMDPEDMDPEDMDPAGMDPAGMGAGLSVGAAGSARKGAAPGSLAWN
jgi:hypothetical protein